ncbi:MAG: hypothetical protein AABY98_07080, partial [Candidatus Deferrimicrobiota bacterium]
MKEKNTPCPNEIRIERGGVADKETTLSADAEIADTLGIQYIPYGSIEKGNRSWCSVSPSSSSPSRSRSPLPPGPP